MSVIKFLLFISLTLHVLSVSMPNLATGRWSTTKILPPQVDRYVKQKHPQLVGARATHIQSQVVRGTNYRITYQGSNVRALVQLSYQSWNNAFKQTSYRRL